jgi:hypothetical protein
MQASFIYNSNIIILNLNINILNIPIGGYLQYFNAYFLQYALQYIYSHMKVVFYLLA